MEEITRVQQLYIQELERSVLHPHTTRHILNRPRIWNKYKDEFAKARLREMKIIE